VGKQRKPTLDRSRPPAQNLYFVYKRFRRILMASQKVQRLDSCSGAVLPRDKDIERKKSAWYPYQVSWSQEVDIWVSMDKQMSVLVSFPAHDRQSPVSLRIKRYFFIISVGKCVVCMRSKGISTSRRNKNMKTRRTHQRIK